jgi:ribonuclease HII
MARREVPRNSSRQDLLPGTPEEAAADRFAFERRLLRRGLEAVAGVDEAGRGPLAGPVVVAAAIFASEVIDEGLPTELSELNDSKQLTASARDGFFALLTTWPRVRFAIAQSEPAAIDEINILRATHRAMCDAVSRLQPPPQHVLVDGLPVATLRIAQTALIRGDARSYSIAAASVLAKVTRDRIMLEYDRLYPEYGFARHKGYGTPEHLAALARHGPCPIHRRSFAPCQPAEPELF